MGTLNGKLINQELSNFDELAQRTERINQRFEHLESQITAISKQDYTQYLQKVSEEVNSNKSYLQKMEQKIGFLEDVTSRQAKQLFFLKISSVIGLIALWFIFAINNQPEDHKIQHQKKTKSLEFIQPESRNGLFLDI